MPWEWLQESEISDSKYVLPSRTVLAFNAEAGTYRAWVKSIAPTGETKIHHGLVFQRNNDAVCDF